MGAVWRDDSAYLALVDAKRHPKSTERAGAAPAPPAPSDVQYVNDLADDFGDMYDDSPDGPEWAINLSVAVVGTAIGVGLIAFCIGGAVTVARWLGWA